MLESDENEIERQASQRKIASLTRIALITLVLAVIAIALIMLAQK